MVPSKKLARRIDLDIWLHEVWAIGMSWALRKHPHCEINERAEMVGVWKSPTEKE